MAKSSFYADGEIYDTAEVESNDQTSSSTPSSAPSAFYGSGGVYDALRDQDDFVAEIDAIRDEAVSSKDAAAASAAAAAASLSAMSPATVAPLMDGVADVGVATKYAREDHVHPTDTTRAPLASPAFTGTPTAPTPANADNSTKIATTAWVQTNAPGTPPATVAPLMDGVADVGVATKYAREDHVHPTDTTRAPLASPAFTGTPTAPTPANADNSTKIATTAWVQTNAPGTPPATVAPLMDGVAAVGTATKYAREDHVHPTDTTRAPLASPALTGSPTAPTAAARSNSTLLATTAYVDTATRERLTTNRTYYVRTDGNDSNDGLTNSAGGAFLTLQQAMTAISRLDCSTFNVEVMVGNGTYTAGLVLRSYIGSGIVTFTGNTTTPSSCTISSAGQCIATSAFGGSFIVRGFKVVSSTSQDVAILTPTAVTLTDMEYGGQANYNIYATFYGRLTLSGANHKVSGTGFYGLFLVEIHGLMYINSATITFLSNKSYSVSTATARQLGYLECAGATFSLGGFTVTATRYQVSNAGGIAGTGGGASFFPGTVNGNNSGGFYA